ncbi:MAG: dihydroorotate dehydrogenase electron transfer subunit [Candidatus Aenigmatarchaeota archaeon]
MNKEPLEIERIVNEGRDIKTFFFDKEILGPNPGRFVQAWIPEYGEKPFSLSYTKPLGITARRIDTSPSDPMRGKFTNKLFGLREGDYVWFTGPRGRGFPLQEFSNDVCIVGGGTGIAPLALLAEELPRANAVSFIGAKSVDEMIMKQRFYEPHVTTDDGSYGERGFVTDALKRYDLNSLSQAKAAICGPEKMMSKAASILEEYIPAENIYISVERLMKCGVGLCGSCDFGGYRACVDGPVFTYAEIKSVPDFGKFKRSRCGGKEFL